MAQVTGTLERARWYQTILKFAFGFRHIEINGNHNDPATQASLRQVQQQLGLDQQTGFLTVASNAALTQGALSLIYRDPHPEPSGQFTKELRDAIRRFQTDNNLEVDGKVGSQTRDRMNAVLEGQVPTPVRRFHSSLAIPSQTVPPRIWLPKRQLLETSTMPGRPGTGEWVSNPADPPFRWMCELIMRVPGLPDPNNSGHGSGVLISPRHILTCAHNVFNDFNDEDGLLRLEHVAGISAIPASDQRPRDERIFPTKPFGSLAVKDDFYDPRWERVLGNYLFHDDYDFAVLTLRKPIDMSMKPVPRRGQRPPPELMSRFGYWGFRSVERIGALIDDSAPLTSEDASSKIARVVHGDMALHSVGYPGGHGIQVHATGHLLDPPRRNRDKNNQRAALPPKDRLLDVDYSIGSRYFLNTLGWNRVFNESKGSSGSPVWVESGARHVRTLFGINIRGGSTTHGLIALSPAILFQIEDEFPETFETYVMTAPGGRRKIWGLRVRDSR